MIFAIDAIDREIVAELEAEGRLTVTALADRVRLSVAPCHRRLRELERVGVIRGYRAVVDPAALGLGFEVLVYVTMEREDGGAAVDLDDRDETRRRRATLPPLPTANSRATEALTRPRRCRPIARRDRADRTKAFKPCARWSQSGRRCASTTRAASNSSEPARARAPATAAFRCPDRSLPSPRRTRRRLTSNVEMR